MYMNSDQGGPYPSEPQQETAAEIARKKVLAAYSSTVDSVNHLPTASRERLLNTTPEPQNSRETAYDRPDSSQLPPETDLPSYHDAETNNYYSATSDRFEPSSEYSMEDTSSSERYDRYYNPESTPEPYDSAENASALKKTPISQEPINEEWAKYHSAWQDYYKKYYNDYYAKAAQNYIATEKMKNERIASGKARRAHNMRRLLPILGVVLVFLVGLFLQYNRLIFAPLMAYVSPDTGSVATSIEAVDPNITQAVSPEPRLIIPKLNIDVPVEYNVPLADMDAAMNRGVAQFAIPGANAMPGKIGNLVLSGHSAGDIYSSNPYKFIFSGLERLENGDLIYINYDSVRYTYQMVKRETVEPTDVASLIYETDKPMLTLITCTPLGTSRYRLLITAEQISPDYGGAENPDAEEPTPSPEEPVDATMPANEPSFFEKIWQGIFGS